MCLSAEQFLKGAGIFTEFRMFGKEGIDVILPISKQFRFKIGGFGDIGLDGEFDFAFVACIFDVSPIAIRSH